MKFFQKKTLDYENNLNLPIDDRNHISLSASKLEIMAEMAEGVREAKIILKRMIIKDFYWSLLISNLDDMNIRGKQIDFLWLASGEDYQTFIHNIEFPKADVVERVNIFSALYGYVDKAFVSGATHMRLMNANNTSLYISETEANSFIQKSIAQYYNLPETEIRIEEIYEKDLEK